MRDQFSLLPVRDLLHKVNDSRKRLLIFFYLGVLFLGTQKDKFGVSLACSALHLDESFDREQLIQTDHLIACRHVEPFFDNVRRDEHIDLAASEQFECLFKLVLGQFDALARRHLTQNVLEDLCILSLGLCRLASPVNQILRLETHCEANFELVLVQKSFTNANG